MLRMPFVHNIKQACEGPLHALVFHIKCYGVHRTPSQSLSKLLPNFNYIWMKFRTLYLCSSPVKLGITVYLEGLLLYAPQDSLGDQIVYSHRYMIITKQCWRPWQWLRPVPGEAGESGANDGVKHCDRHVATVEGAVYPLIWDNVRRVGNGRTCRRNMGY